MKIVIQRTTEASVTVDNEIIGKIGKGYLVLLGVEESDSEKEADKLINKMVGLRIFPDENDKSNLSLKDVNGELLIISQFTLMADCRKGRRPSFIKSGNPTKAEALYEYFIKKCREQVAVVERGSFGADMKVSLVNDGPFTIILDSAELA